MHHTIWINSALPDAADIFGRNLRYLLDRVNPHKKPLAFACIGSANTAVPFDNLGPLMGTILTRHGLPNVYGTMDCPLNALTLPHYMSLLKVAEKNCCLIAIDAAMGTPAQSGHLTLCRGRIHPGSALNRKLPPVGALHITGVFKSFDNDTALPLISNFCFQITAGLLLSKAAADFPDRPVTF